MSFGGACQQIKNSWGPRESDTQNPGLVRATVNSWGFVLARNKQLPGDGVPRLFFTFFLVVVIVVVVAVVVRL